MVRVFVQLCLKSLKMEVLYVLKADDGWFYGSSSFFAIDGGVFFR